MKKCTVKGAVFAAAAAAVLCTGCSRSANPETVYRAEAAGTYESGSAFFEKKAVKSYIAAVTPAERRLERVVQNIRFPGKDRFLKPENRAVFIAELEEALAADTDGLLLLADKQHFLQESYIPPDLVTLEKGASYIPGRTGLSLRKPAEAALEKMSRAALAAEVKLVASSTYRSYAYQVEVYNRNVRELGKAAADRESAAPGASQHQLGTVVDFGSITDEFAETKAGRWLKDNAAQYGFSLSFPAGYEDITGYRWESWHYRYIGQKAAAFQKKWFNDIQQYMMEFIYEWKKAGDSPA